MMFGVLICIQMNLMFLMLVVIYMLWSSENIWL